MLRRAAVIGLFLDDRRLDRHAFTPPPDARRRLPPPRRHADLARSSGSAPDPSPPTPAGSSPGSLGRSNRRPPATEGVEAVGKNLLLRFEGGVTVRSHLRMNGRWRVGPVGSTGTGRPWLLLRSDLRSRRPSGTGRCSHSISGRCAGSARTCSAKGSDPATLVARLRRADGTRPLGEVLQDQRLVAGIGNMWMSETLWGIRVSPWLPARDSAPRRGVAGRLGLGARGDARFRGGRPAGPRGLPASRPACPRCGTPVESRGQGGR